MLNKTRFVLLAAVMAFAPVWAKAPPPGAAAPEKPVTGPKVGDPCKKDADCSRDGELVCGKGKCEINVKFIPPPT